MKWFLVMLLLIITGFSISFNILLTSNAVSLEEPNTFGTFDSALLQLFALMMGGGLQAPACASCLPARSCSAS